MTDGAGWAGPDGGGSVVSPVGGGSDSPGDPDGDGLSGGGVDSPPVPPVGEAEPLGVAVGVGAAVVVGPGERVRLDSVRGVRSSPPEDGGAVTVTVGEGTFSTGIASEPEVSLASSLPQTPPTVSPTTAAVAQHTAHSRTIPCCTTLLHPLVVPFGAGDPTGAGRSSPTGSNETPPVRVPGGTRIPRGSGPPRAGRRRAWVRFTLGSQAVHRDCLTGAGTVPSSSPGCSMARNRASIKDVAARAGVSLGTVSNVLNRPELVSDGTRERVQAAIAELGFVRNESARQLRAGRSRTIAYVALDASNPFFTDVARGIEEVARAAGLAVYLCDVHSDPRRQQEYLDLLGEQRVQGVLVTPADPDDPRLTELPRRGTPVVLVDRGAADRTQCSVTVDDILGGELAVTHLLDTGHRRVAFVGGPLSIPQVRDRHTGALGAWQRAGRDPADLVRLETEALNVEEGRRAGERLAGLSGSRRPTAAFCANDLLALGLLQEMTRHGLAVPDDVAIVGYDDILFAEAAAVPLTSVRQPRHQLGRSAAELLIEETGDDPEHVHQQLQFQPELVARASSSLGHRRRAHR